MKKWTSEKIFDENMLMYEILMKNVICKQHVLNSIVKNVFEELKNILPF